MAVLNAWQRLDRVISGKPFGDGGAGNATLSSDPCTRASLSTIASGNTGITIGSAILSDGDVFALHQSRGTGAGQWEINRVSSGGGTTSIVCSQALHYSYASSGASVAQVIKIPLYDVVGINSFTIGNWDKTKGGISFVVGKTSVTLNSSQTLTLSGGAAHAPGGSTQQSGQSVDGGGFHGGYGVNLQDNPTYGGSGEGTVGDTVTSTTAANGNGGGAGKFQASGNPGGGGGGNIASGSSGSGTTGGTGGGTGSSADGITLTFGGGGAGSAGSTDDKASGGGGGGLLIVITNSFTVSGTSITANGANGGANYGGAGAGGFVLIECGIASLGTGIITATGGTGNSGGGNGGVGGIAVHHSGTVTGTTNPTFTDVSDATLIEGGFVPKILFL